MQRVLSGTVNTLTAAFSVDEAATTATGSVTITVTGPTGAVVLGPTDASLDADSKVYSAVLGPQTNLGVYTATWSGSFSGYVQTIRSAVEVVGGFLFSISEARASDMDIADTARFPASAVRDKRNVVEAEFERICNRSFTRRGKAVAFTCDGTDEAHLRTFDVAALKALTIDGTVVDVADFTVDEDGFLTGLAGYPEGVRGLAVIEYGFANPPDDIKEAGLTLLRYRLAAKTSAVPDRATNFVAAEGGQFTLATPGRNGWETGIPDVDAALTRYTYRILRDAVGGW